MKTLQEKIDVMNHFLNGGEIEWMLKDIPVDDWATWKLYGEPSWNWERYDYRIKKMPKFRLPTKEELENLIEHFSRWNKEKKGLEIENYCGDILFLAASGYQDGISSYNVGSLGHYWSSTVFECDNNYAYYIYFDSNCKNVNNSYRTHCCKQTVRLVSDAPFDGGIEFNGVWWKPENEEGYYTYEEAIEKFNKYMERTKYQFRLPTKEEFEKLIKNFSRWNEEYKSLDILSNSLRVLTFPAYPPYCDSVENDSKEVYGNYWSSTMVDGLNNDAYLLSFSCDNRIFVNTCSRNCACNVRLVSDEPFEGGIEVNGVYWKPENEVGHYNFYAAIENFNK